MAGVFFTLNPKHTEGARDPDWKYVLLPSLDESLAALSEGVKNQRDKYAAAIQRMMDLRGRITLHWGPNSSAPIDSTDKFIDEILRPYMQLCSDTRLYFRLPPDELPENAAKLLASSSAPVPFLVFQWKCAFGRQVLTSGSISAELCCLLFNLGVLIFNRATATMYASAAPDACKAAFKDFQLAAGVWEQGRALSDKLPLDKLSFDIMPSCFSLLTEVAVGMAHRCAYIKATEENATKDNKALLSKLAMTGAKHLNHCYEVAATLAEGRQINDDFRLLQLGIKDNAALLEADAYLHMMAVELKVNECGAVIAKGRIAIALLAEQVNGNLCASPSNKDWLSAKCGEVRAVHDEAQTFNNTVYFKAIPDAIEPLPALQAPLGKPVPLFTDWSAVDEKAGQPFKGLVGPEIIPILAQFREQITAEYGKLSKSTAQRRQQASDALVALQLDVILCQTEEGMKPRLPHTLRERVLRLQSQAASFDEPGNNGSEKPEQQQHGHQKATPATMLQSMLRHVASVSAAAEPILDDAKDLLDRDDERDKKFLNVYGEKLWRARIHASSDLPDIPLYRRKIAELRSDLAAKVKEPLQSIVKALNDNAQALLRVCIPVEDLDAMIPASAAPTKEQLEVTGLRNRLVELRQSFDVLNEMEMQLLKGVPPLISSPDTAAALCAAKGGSEREDVLAKKQVEFIDSFAGIQALGDQREAQLKEMEQLVTKLAETESTDPLFLQKAEVIKTVERGIHVVEGAVMRISDIGQVAAQSVENANILRQYTSQLLAARDVEARAVSAQLDVSIQDQMSRMKSAPELGPRRLYEPASPVSTSDGGSGSMMGSRVGSSNNFGQQAPPAPPPPPPRTASSSSADFDPFAVSGGPTPTVNGQQQHQQRNAMDNIFGNPAAGVSPLYGSGSNRGGGGSSSTSSAYQVPDFANPFQ